MSNLKRQNSAFPNEINTFKIVTLELIKLKFHSYQMKNRRFYSITCFLSILVNSVVSPQMPYLFVSGENVPFATVIQTMQVTQPSSN